MSEVKTQEIIIDINYNAVKIHFGKEVFLMRPLQLKEALYYYKLLNSDTVITTKYERSSTK